MITTVWNYKWTDSSKLLGCSMLFYWHFFYWKYLNMLFSDFISRIFFITLLSSNSSARSHSSKDNFVMFFSSNEDYKFMEDEETWFLIKMISSSKPVQWLVLLFVYKFGYFHRMCFVQIFFKFVTESWSIGMEVEGLVLPDQWFSTEKKEFKPFWCLLTLINTKFRQLKVIFTSFLNDV